MSAGSIRVTDVTITPVAFTDPPIKVKTHQNRRYVVHFAPAT